MSEDQTSKDLIALQNAETGKSYFEAFQAKVLALGDLGNQLPSLDLRFVPEQMLAAERDIREHEEAVVARLAPDTAQEFKDALSDVRPLAHAMFYAATVLATDPRAVRLSEIMPDATALQKLGHHWLKILGQLMVVKQEKVDAILKGRSWRDRAGDLQRMSPILEKHWSLLEPLQAVQPDDTTVLTPERIAKMAVLGTELVELVSGKKRSQPGQIDWRRQLIGLFELLEPAHHVARTETVAYLRLHRRDAEADALKSIWAMRRPSKPTAKEDDESEADKDTPETDSDLD